MWGLQPQPPQQMASDRPVGFSLGWCHAPTAVGLIGESREGERDPSLMPSPGCLWLTSAAPCLILSLSGWSSRAPDCVAPWLGSLSPTLPPPSHQHVSLHIHPSTTLILFCSSPCSRGPLLQPLQAVALDLCKSGFPFLPHFPCAH